MSCINSKAPINIPDKSSTLCVEKCSLVYNFGESSFSIKNNGDYLSLGYDVSTSNVLYNTLKVEVQDIRIYTPSLHSYNGSRTDAEMIIVMSGFGTNVLVCIPIKSSEVVDDSASFISLMISNSAGSIANSGGSLSKGSVTWSLNDFVPNKKPLFAYTSTLPYTPCSGEYNYLVWNVNDYFIPFSSKILAVLTGVGDKPGLITKQNYDIKSGPEVFYNQYGAVNSTFAGDDDDIYIECKPTGDEGEVLFKKSTSGDSETDTTTAKAPTIDDIMNNPATEIILGLLAAFVVYKIGETVWKKLKKDD